jgi:hypothetical protein
MKWLVGDEVGIAVCHDPVPSAAHQAVQNDAILTNRKHDVTDMNIARKAEAHF